jgi:hypothetical protein
MTATSGSDKPPQGINRRRLLLRLACLPVFIALFMFLPAGTWAWPKGWLFVVVVLVVVSAVFLVLHRVNPEVIVARSRFQEGTKGWDKILLSFYFPAMLAVILLAALDDECLALSSFAKFFHQNSPSPFNGFQASLDFSGFLVEVGQLFLQLLPVKVILPAVLGDESFDFVP